MMDMLRLVVWCFGPSFVAINAILIVVVNIVGVLMLLLLLWFYLVQLTITDTVSKC